MELKLLAVVIALTLPLSLFAENKADTIWQVGTFDGSSGEFAGGEPLQAVTYRVGQDQPQTNWYAFDPVTSASKPTDPASAPRSVEFSVSGRPDHAYRLRISVLIEHPSVPALRVDINGRAGTFYLHPKLDYDMGDTSAAFDPAYARAEVAFDFPNSWIKTGENRISFQAISTSSEIVPDAGFNYDAIELQRIDSLPQPTSAQIEPTIFFQKHGASSDERVDVFVRYGQRPRSGRVQLSIAGHTDSSSLRGAQDFGEERFSFNVPEFSANTRARVRVDLNGRSAQWSQILQPQKKWTLFLVPHVHLDVGFTDYQSKVAAIQSRILDEAVDLAAKHPDFRFSTDGEWNLKQFLESRTPEQKERLIEAIRQQKIYIPAQPSNILTGFPTAETLIRSLYPSADFSRTHVTPFNYANITDVPSYSWSYASILAAAGIQYFLAGSNNYRAPVLMQGHLNEHSPFWWVGPDGGKVLMWYSRHYMQMQFIFGLPPLTQAGEEVLPLFLQIYRHPDYRANVAIIFGTQVENTDLYPQQSELVDQWNAHHEFPHLEFSGFHDALANVAGQFGDAIPTVLGDGGPYWEDGIGSDAYHAAIERENECRAPSAEKLATISTLVNPRLAVNRDKVTSLWENMVLMDEHTWTSWNSVTDPDSNEASEQLHAKDAHAAMAAELRDDLLRTSMAGIADSIAAGVNSLIVFNPLNWKRDGEVTVDLDNDKKIVDRSSKADVPYFMLHQGRNFRRVIFRAVDVPAVGYKVYELQPAKTGQAQTEKATETTIESPYYRVELDPSSGCIRSIFDKQLRKELVDTTSPWRFGQYIYVTGGDEEPNSILRYRMVSPRPTLSLHPAKNGRLISVEKTPWGWRAQLVSSTENTPEIHTEVRVFTGAKKIELIEDVEKKPELRKEAVYFSFPFAMTHPQFQYEIQNGVVDPAKDMYPGAGHEWFSVQHWISVQQDGVSATVMPLDAPLATLGDINRGAWPAEFGSRPGNIFSYVMNNYWDTNYSASQGGHFRFRYVITSSTSTDAPALSRMAWEEVTPLEVDQIRSQDKAVDSPRPLNGDQGSFLSVDDPDLVVDTWKPAEDGKGTILRFIDLGGRTRTVTVSVPLLSLGSVFVTDAVERNQKAIKPDGPHNFRIDVQPHQIITVRLVAE